jgi:isoquinoline 1-oxidoreductase subunit beta
MSTPTDTAAAMSAPRRQFLQHSLWAGGGLLIGLSLNACAKPAELANGNGGQPNAWLRISADNTITILIDKSEMGQGVYTALPALVAEELALPLERVRVEFAPAGMPYVNTLLGSQVTGGSTSVREGWQKLRQAGASAREMLLGAAADAWQVDVASLKLADGAIVNAAGQRKTFGELAAAAQARGLPKNATLKAASEFTLIGKPQRRLDSPQKVDGSAQFGLDVQLPKMKYASFIQSPVLGGKVKSVDASGTAGMPGNVRVVTTGSGVAVVADHYWQAVKARAHVNVQWDAGANAGLSTASIFKGLGEASGAGQSARLDGDAAAALKTAHTLVSATYQLPLLAHATMEPMNCTADYKTDRCDVYVGTQVQQIAQASVAQAVGLSSEQVNIHTTFLGGGFGRRLEVDFIPAAAEASKALGVPVKIIWQREDDMTHDAYRPPALDTATAAVDAKGQLQAVSIKLVSPSITARMFPPVVEKVVDPFAVEAAQNYLYDVPNVAVNYLRHEIGINVGYWRSVSHALNCFVVESFMDELAHAAKQDPYHYRRELLRKQPRALAVLNAAAERAAWGQVPAGHFQGIAVMEGYGTYLAQVVEVSLQNAQIKIHKITCAVDCGQMINPSIVESQITSGIVFGLSAALWGEITLQQGQVEQTNFDNYRVLRIHETPQMVVHLIDSHATPGGIGEPSTAVVGPALANAVFAATRKRARALPLNKTVSFI